MVSVLEHALLGLAVAALTGAAWQTVALSGARGLDLALGAAPLAAGAAVIEALLLGVVGLGGSPVALGLAAALTWLAIRARPSAPAPRPFLQLREWWRRRSAPERIGIGAVIGLALAYGIFLMRFPALGDDGLDYHLPAAAGWVSGGHTGAVISYFDDLPTGNYPITDEVLVAWGVGLSQSLVLATLWPFACMALLGVASWHGLRLLSVPRFAAAMAAAALVLSPITLTQVIGPNTDLPATAWLVTCGALCAGSRRHPALLAPALMAAGLAIGVKTTTAVPALAALGSGCWVARARLRSLARPLALTAVAGAVVGLTWYARNLITHGGPLWPLATTPIGDPVPFTLAQIDGRLIADLGSVPDRAGGYAGQLGGGLVLLVGALVAPVAARRREVAAAGGVALLCFLVWMNAPYTGYPRGQAFDFSATNAVRYLLPGLAAAALTLALAAHRPGVSRWLAVLALAGSLVWNVERDIALGFPFAPGVRLVVVALLVGAAAGYLGRSFAWLPTPRGAVPVAAAAVGGLLAWPASGYLDRHLAVDAFAQGSARYIASRPSYSNGTQPVWALGTVNGALVGDRLRHRVSLLPRHESCPDLLRRVRRGWVVIPQPIPNPSIAPPPESVRRDHRIRRCLTRVRPGFQDAVHQVYGPG